MASKMAVVTASGMVLGAGRMIWDGRDWPELRDARIDAIVVGLEGDGWAVSDHRPATQVAAARLLVDRPGRGGESYAEAFAAAQAEIADANGAMVRMFGSTGVTLEKAA
jgi:hypothetical protein